MLIPLKVAKYAVEQLAKADYNIATKISEDVALFVPWALSHDLGVFADLAMTSLKTFDELGSIWILIACWLVNHAH